MKMPVSIFRLAGVAVAGAAALGTLHAQLNDRAQAWFPDGTGLEIYTESNGSTRLSPQGGIGIGPGEGSPDKVNRMVTDSGNHLLFAYNLEASRGAKPGTVIIRIEPLSAATEAEMVRRPGMTSQLPDLSGAHVPTVAGVREFQSVKIGEVLTLDILYNPATGEKIYDVLRPITGPSPAPGHMSVTSSRSRDEISLREIAVKVNKVAMGAPISWMIGGAVRIDIPGHGTYVVAAFEPKNLPPIYTFKALARADGRTLRWTIDGDSVEIDSSTNVLTQAETGVLWVYHDSGYRSQDQPNAVRLQTADTVEWLIPRR